MLTDLEIAWRKVKRKSIPEDAPIDFKRTNEEDDTGDSSD